MKYTVSIFGLLLMLLLVAGVASADVASVSAFPNPAVVGQNVMVTITATGIAAAPCSIPVFFGDGGSTTMVCPTTGTCVRSFPHIYTAADSYLFGAETTDCAAAGRDAVLTVNCPPLNIVTSALPGGIVGQPYNAQLISSGGIAPITWTLSEVSDNLPAGLVLLPGGLITGTPTTYENVSLRVVAVDSCGDGTVDQQDLSINIATPATSELVITRMQLSFDNGRAETTVNRNQPGLRVNADLRFDGSGLLKGYWEVDGRLLAQVNQHLTYGKSIRLSSPAAPFLPTFVEGSHRVRLVITSPANEIPFPEAIYYVTSEESTAGLAPIRAVEPRDHAELVFAPHAFSWKGSGTEVVYLIEFFEREGEDPIAAAYTRDMSYDLPASILTDSFASGKNYLWRVKSYDAEGGLLGISELSHFIFQ